MSNETSNSSVPESNTHIQDMALAALLSVVIVVVIIGNTLVILAVVTTRRLRTVTNCFVMSLAIADWLVGVFVMPPAVAYVLMGVWELGWILCDIWISLDILLCTASILSLCAISVDRYLAVTQPLSYSRKRRSKRLAFTMILVVWLSSALITCPPIFGWYESGKHENKACRYNRNTGYVVFSAMGSFFIPMAVMLYVYVRISCVVAQRHDQLAHIDTHSRKTAAKEAKQAKESARKRNISLLMDDQTKNEEVPAKKQKCEKEKSPTSSLTSIPDKDLFLVPMADHEALEQKFFAAKNEIKILKEQNEELRRLNLAWQQKFMSFEMSSIATMDVSKDRPYQVKSQKYMMNVKEESDLERVSSECEEQNLRCSSSQSAEPVSQINNEQRKSLGTRSLRSTLNYSFNHEPITTPQRAASLYKTPPLTSQPSRPESINFDASILNFEPATRVSSFRRETKTAQTLSIVMGGFIACWLPFFIFYLLTPFIPTNEVNSLIMSYLTWLGWFNSAINPFIYAFYSPDFRIAFWRLTIKHFSKSRRADFAFQHK